MSRPPASMSEQVLTPPARRPGFVFLGITLGMTGGLVTLLILHPDFWSKLCLLMDPGIAAYALGFLTAALGLGIASHHYARLFEERLQNQIAPLSKLEKTLSVNIQGIEETNRFKAEFLNRMSHELRTPLTSIIGFSDMLLTLNSFGLTETQRRHVQIVNTNGRHLLRVAENLMDVSCLELGDQAMAYRLANVSLVGEEVIRALTERLDQRRQSVRFQPEASLPAIEMDEMRVRKILISLADTASRLLPEGGRMTLKIYRKEGEMIFCMSDNGPGMSAREASHLEEALKEGVINFSEGNRMGLAVSKRYAELLGGRIWFASKPGQGNRFFLSLPIRRETKPPDA